MMLIVIAAAVVWGVSAMVRHRRERIQGRSAGVQEAVAQETAEQTDRRNGLI
jgi:hypothetical protein